MVGVSPIFSFIFPAWIMIFPNSIPSQFVSDGERNKKFQALKNLQENAAEKLEYIMPSYM